MNILDELAFRQTMRGDLLSRPPHGEDARKLAGYAFESAALFHALANQHPAEPGLVQGDDNNAQASLAEGAAAAAAAVLGFAYADQAGLAAVELGWPDGSFRRIPLGGVSFGPSDWWRALACALLVRDHDAANILCHPPHVDRMLDSPYLADGFWPPLCHLVAQIVRGETPPADWFAQAAAALEPSQIVHANLAVVRRELQPLLPVLQALIANTGFAEAWHHALSLYRAADSGHDGIYSQFPLELYGLAALAHDLGIDGDRQAVSNAFINPAASPPLLTVTFAHCPRLARNAEETLGFFDLRGYPRQGREHQLLFRDGQAIAHDTVTGYPGIPRISAEFLLAEAADTAAPGLPVALDPGENLLLAQRYANAAGVCLERGESDAARAWLSAAVGRVESSLAAIPQGMESVPPAAFVNALGQAAYQAEPGRFRRDRLTAYRDSLASHLSLDHPADIERHATGAFAQWQADYQASRSRFADSLAHLGEMPEAIGSLISLAAGQAALESLRPDNGPAVAASVQRVATLAAAACLLAQNAPGWVRFALDGEERELPVTGPHSGLHFGIWLLGFSCSLICRDQTATAVLCRSDSIEAALSSPTQGDEFWQFLAQTLAAVAHNDPKAWAENTGLARQLMQPDTARHINPEFVALTKLPLLDVADALMAGQSGAWQARVLTALQQHRRFWSAADTQGDSFGFLAFDLCGLAALARDRGIGTTAASAYLPAYLIDPPAATSPSGLCFCQPRQTARSVREIQFYCAAQDPLGPQTHHELLDDGGKLVALYQLARKDGGEDWQLEFDLSGLAGHSRLLDAGEWLALADRYAQAAPAALHNLPPAALNAAVGNVQAALECLEEVLQFIPATHDTVPAGAIWTDKGKALFDEEPGRFDRARLQAVIGRYRQLLPAQASETAAPPATAPDPRELALGFVAIIRAQAQPVLQALAQDRSGQFARQLQPRGEDYAKVFSGELTEAARAYYQTLWGQALSITYPNSTQTAIRCHAAPAGLLAGDNELSRHFPGGYRQIAGSLNPHRIWLAWHYTAPGETSGLAYDGLVWVDDHWAWFPKPYRAVKPG